MYNCIFTAHCTESICDKSCPTLVETSYLLERNGITMNSPAFKATHEQIDDACRVLLLSTNSIGAKVVTAPLNTVYYADVLTYCAICQNWQGNRLHCNVYNLKYSKYLDEMKQSWGMKSEPESLEYMRIWSESAKILIVSNFDYVNFGDFESQTLLNLLQLRQMEGLSTIFVTPPLTSLVSTKSSRFFNTLKSILADAVKRVRG